MRSPHFPEFLPGQVPEMKVGKLEKDCLVCAFCLS